MCPWSHLFLGRTYVSLTLLADVRISGCWLNTRPKNSSNTDSTLLLLQFDCFPNSPNGINWYNEIYFLGTFYDVRLDCEICDKIPYDWRIDLFHNLASFLKMTTGQILWIHWMKYFIALLDCFSKIQLLCSGARSASGLAFGLVASKMLCKVHL